MDELVIALTKQGIEIERARNGGYAPNRRAYPQGRDIEVRPSRVHGYEVRVYGSVVSRPTNPAAAAGVVGRMLGVA